MRFALIATFLAVVRSSSADVACQVFQVDVQYEESVNRQGATKYQCIPDAADENGVAGISYEIKGLDPTFIEANSELLKSGDGFINVPGGVRDRGNAAVAVPPGAQVSIEARQKPRKLRAGGGERHLAPKSIGTSSVLVLRVVTDDASTSASVATLSDRVFGTSGDAVNLKSQTADCSFGDLTFNPATGTGITNGVAEVTLSLNANGASSGTLENAVTTAATAIFGDLGSNFDHVMYCLPPGTSGGWIAYGYFNYYRTVYNDDWCTYVSAQMHELGHNLNLQHAGQGGDSYGDQTGMMGYSYGSSDTPVMCFNAAKSWQLGWYSDRRTTPDLTSDAATIKLAPINDYEETTSDHTVILKLEAGSTDYFLLYNKNEGVNSGTVEYANLVTVATQSGSGTSSLVGTIGNGGTYKVRRFASVGKGKAKDLVIEVCDVVSGTPDYAQLSLYIEGVSSSTCPGAPAPAPATTPGSPPTGSCGGNKDSCSSNSDCCSNNCKRGTCKGGG